jgi:plasmid maintenance system antidote protein VapI
MEDIREVSDEDLKRPGPCGIVDERAAEELGMTVDELAHILRIWEKRAAEVARERVRRGRQRLATERRTVLK